MTSDQMDALAERLAFQAVEVAGTGNAPGVLLQAMLLAHLEHHSLDALVFCLERTVEGLRVDLANQMAAGGTIQ